MTTSVKSPFLPAADYVRVEARIGGVTYTFELEPGPSLPIAFTANVDTEVREDPCEMMWRKFEPGIQTVAIQTSGKLARAERTERP